MTNAIEHCEGCAELAAVTLRFDGEHESHRYCVWCAERVRLERSGPRFVIRRDRGLRSPVVGWRCACGELVATAGTADAARAWRDHVRECPEA